jgi:hypothetical protein
VIPKDRVLSNGLCRLHLLGPSWTVMLTCKTVLITEWVLIATPNFILSVAAARSSKFDYAYSISQRIEPTIYATVSLLLSAVYMYYAYVVFRSDRDQQVRRFLVRLLCTNLFLMVLDSANIVLEYVGGGIVQTGYAAFFFSFVCCTRRSCLCFADTLLAVKACDLDAQRNRFVRSGKLRQVRRLKHDEVNKC